MGDKPAVDRKYKIALLSLILCTVCFVGTGFFKGLKDTYGTFVMAVGMVLGLYGGANVGNKWVLAKHGILKASDGESSDETEQISVENNPPTGKP